MSFPERIGRVTAEVERLGLSGLLVAPGPDLLYLTGHAPPPLERLTLLVLDPRREPTMLVPALELPAAETAPGIGDVNLIGWPDGEDPYPIAAGLLRAGRYAVTDQTWASHVLGLLDAAAGCELVPVGRALPLLRAVKDPDEVAALHAAGRAADLTFGEIVRLPFAGRREIELAADLDRLLRAFGHERVEFTIVGSGPNSASPHHEPGDRVIASGDAVVMDFGGVMGGYCSDLTRTAFVGQPNPEQMEVYEVVRSAQEAAFAAVGPGALAQDVDRAARLVISEAGFGDRFIHRTGHGIGLEVHEPPYIVEGDQTVLEVGMTFSDEPGIYLEGRFGVRIEDQVVVTSDGAEWLNEASRELTVVA